ncbi:TPA: ATP-dependent endonuclease [Streptococcus pneumoniae]|uniref:ATP-dependent nuclease n=1 Tax=Streptococcus TaxID=1301 RepID=UPI000660141B|nr:MULTISPECIES: ATP-dependent endonuclease [Streptococcus]MDV8826781.1 ATP-dependent endonuclease [Streptococcus pneumoniae]VNJ93479.1 putative ATP-dependent endonuclease of the OLDfamily [Streptococcus pneumoniae]VOK65585.1 putative ATP-dependent endonuclease of the OLDfamily [Streptococcus pneumoniae]HEU3312017.1 ATP-dependent endonuclease [Streptococcus pneumoniae]HEU3412367.1 ATP-dependent endonuclease [Streptococcus pneumoniae]
MKIKKIYVQNYRLLKDFSLELKNDLSLIVGKNNCGKTSVLSVLEKIFNKNSGNTLTWEDISLSHRKEIYEKVKLVSDISEKDWEPILGTSLQIWIQYSEIDSYQNIQTFMMDLNPDNNFIILEFTYIIPIQKLRELNLQVSDFIDDFSRFESFMKKNMSKLFEMQIYSLGYNPSTQKLTEEKSDLLEMKDVHKIIKVRGISASREVSNKENNHSLSKTSNQFYKLNNGEDIDSNANNLLKSAILKADETLTKAYSGDDSSEGIFTPVFERVKRFGGNDSEAELAIHSSLSEKDIISNNTTLYYKHDDSLLPETYNGLGYLNLYGIIFEIETVMADIKKDPADINLVYIEEPESHTHPQLQYIFIKNIKDLLKVHDDELKARGDTSGVQTLITTHSSHIVSDCSFDDLIYFKRDNGTAVSKAFNSLKEEYGDEQLGYKFVKQYLTLNSSELFFADKVICVEGDTERILIPTMMQKVDIANPINKASNTMPLLSQNISIIETGAHSQVFRKLFDFLGIKVLIITDIDPANKNENNRMNSCSAVDATSTTNTSIKSFFDISGDEIFSIVTQKSFAEKISSDYRIRIAYQIPEDDNGYQPASFEDAFIGLNKEFIIKHKDGLIEFEALKNFDDGEIEDFYEFARNKVNKKSAFASSLLYFEDEENTWKVPNYISEGLLWLREQ